MPVVMKKYPLTLSMAPNSAGSFLLEALLVVHQRAIDARGFDGVATNPVQPEHVSVRTHETDGVLGCDLGQEAMALDYQGTHRPFEP
jgi:hypothetical protein